MPLFYCWSSVAEFIIFWDPPGLSVSLSLSCARLMVSEAARISVNASLALVGPAGIDLEEDERGHRAGGNEEAKAYTMALLTDCTYPSQTHTLTMSLPTLL